LLLLIGAGVGAVIYLEDQRASSRRETAVEAEPPPRALQQEPETSVPDANAAKPTPPPQETQPPPRSQVEQPRKVAAAPAAAAKPPQPKPQSNSSSEPASVQFEKDTYVATESDGSVHILVERSGSTAQPASFRWMLRSNSAEPGIDYAGIGPGTEQIAAGASSANITVPLVSDALVENTEVFLIEIEPAQSGLQLGARSHAAVIVVDDD
jgi:Calx-beta domain